MIFYDRAGGRRRGLVGAQRLRHVTGRRAVRTGKPPLRLLRAGSAADGPVFPVGRQKVIKNPAGRIYFVISDRNSSKFIAVNSPLCRGFSARCTGYDVRH